MASAKTFCIRQHVASRNGRFSLTEKDDELENDEKFDREKVSTFSDSQDERPQTLCDKNCVGRYKANLKNR
jgi:hypothetical protein